MACGGLSTSAVGVWGRRRSTRRLQIWVPPTGNCLKGCYLGGRCISRWRVPNASKFGPRPARHLVPAHMPVDCPVLRRHTARSLGAPSPRWAALPSLVARTARHQTDRRAGTGSERGGQRRTSDLAGARRSGRLCTSQRGKGDRARERRQASKLAFPTIGPTSLSGMATGVATSMCAVNWTVARMPQRRPGIGARRRGLEGGSLLTTSGLSPSQATGLEPQ
jgi:hypothetical protein